MSRHKAEEFDWPDFYEEYDAKAWWYDPPWKLYQWPITWPCYFSGDEFMRRTFVVHLPLLGRLVVAVSKPGYHDDPTINAGGIRLKAVSGVSRDGNEAAS